jgi:hypothetical protein
MYAVHFHTGQYILHDITARLCLYCERQMQGVSTSRIGERGRRLERQTRSFVDLRVFDIHHFAMAQMMLAHVHYDSLGGTAV